MVKYIKILVVVLGITAYLSFGDFSVAPNLSVSAKKINDPIYYDNVQYTDNVTFYGVHGSNIEYEGELNKPGDYYELSFDIVNRTNTDVEITKCLSQKNDDYIEFYLTYSNGDKIQVGDTLKRGERKRVVYRVVYKNPIVSESYQFDSSFILNYEQIL